MASQPPLHSKVWDETSRTISPSVSPMLERSPPLHSMLRLDRIVRELGKAPGTGVAADSFGGVTAFLRSGRAPLPDIQLLFVSMGFRPSTVA